MYIRYRLNQQMIFLLNLNEYMFETTQRGDLGLIIMVKNHPTNTVSLGVILLNLWVDIYQYYCGRFQRGITFDDLGLFFKVIFFYV